MTRRWPLVVAVALVSGLTGCELKDGGEDLVAGKQAFVERCGSCHVLGRAGTTGVAGPNLDEAFHQARSEGYGEDTFKGIVHQQILHPAKSAQVDPVTQRRLSPMPAKLVEGQAAENVAAYVARAVAKGGEDTGQLADIGAAQAEGTATAENGTLDIPADPSGALAYEFKDAEAPAGALTLTSENPASIPHNIALEGNGVNEIGEVVQDGGVSEIEVDVEAGEYTFYCSVPGHREGGMAGTLTVE